MEVFSYYLEIGEKPIGLPGQSENFKKDISSDVRDYLEEIWPQIARYKLMDFASDLYLTLGYSLSSPIEQKLYLALFKKFIDELIIYSRKNTVLWGNKKVSEISQFLVERNIPPIYEEGDIDYEIDLFLYLDCRLTKNPVHDKDIGYKYIRSPFYLGICCDGHDFHEKTKEQAQKDKQKDRYLKKRGLDIVRFTGREITTNPDGCADEIKSLMDSYYEKIQKIINAVNKV